MVMSVAPRVFVDRFDPADPAAPPAVVREALEFVGAPRFLSNTTRVFLKPNFTWPTYKPGVTTSPRMIESAVAYLRQWTPHITIVESDGGAQAFSAEASFAGHGIPEICRKYGIRSLGLTQAPRELAETTVAGKRVRVELSSEMLHESDLFITMPAPKVHLMTGVSLAFKNQWGCLPDVKRLRNHPELPYKVLAINKLLRTRIVLFDGTYFLDRTGPLDGEPIPMNLVIASDDPGAGSLACCRIMGIDPRSVPHKKLAIEIGMMPTDPSTLVLNKPLDDFVTHRFTLQRSKFSYLTLAAFHSSLLTWLVYDSLWAKPIHEVLYFFRGRPKEISPYW
jgi:uncharacterized protein (DUF362 family)